MDVQDLFEVFSDEEDDTLTSIPAAIRMSRPIESTDDEPDAKRLKATTTLRALDAENRPLVADEFGTSVDKEYAVKNNTWSQEPAVAPDQPTSEQLVVTHSIRHQVAIPPDYDYVPLSKHVPFEVPARTYPFTLDPFQRTSISSIERNESVLVAAHTSAGKTVVAEYAIALSLRNKQRVIYTSPIKALSNQKYRELLQEFGDVGLMTGDVTINQNASCLVMTTEILRSMLYRGSEVMREVAWVVFDEVHYMRDPERGVVWEETIILLPDKVHYVFLSATIPNAMQFAEWICKIHNQPCHVVYTDFRPTPLQHYLFPSGGEGIYLAVDEKSQFREDNFQKAITALGDKGDGSKSKKTPGKKGRHDKSTQGKSDLYKIIRMIMVKNYHPVIVFSFSKRECEGNALQLSKLDFNDDQEKALVGSVFENAIQSLGEDDRNLPQIDHLLPLLKRGIGIHHSGLLPILKEVIEILFQEGLLKVLFATETFSIGLNMPARTVVFTSVRKFDGVKQRWLGGGEYIQMSGRAGRRGLDDRGIVILMIDEQMEPAVAKGMLKGVSDPLNSAFHLKYSMILNLLRVEGISPEYILERSFFQFQNCAKLPELIKDMNIYEKRYSNLEIENEAVVSDYYQLRSQLEVYQKDMRDVLNHPTYCLPFLQSGRLVRIKREAEGDIPVAQFGWGVIVSFQKVFSKNKADLDSKPTFIVDVLLNCAPGTENKSLVDATPCPEGTKGDMVIVPCTLETMDGLSSVRVFLPKDLKSADNRHQMLKTLNEVQRRFPDGVPLLDPITDMGIKDEGFHKLVKKIQLLEERLFANALHQDPKLPELYELFDTKVQIQKKIRDIKKQISDAESILQLDELKCRRRVLRRLGYTSSADIIETKGRVACEISAGDELVLTEMIFNGSFNDLTVEQTVALLSCFTCAENTKSEGAGSLPAELQGPLRLLHEVAKRVAKVSQESKLTLDETEYIKSFTPDLMEVTYAWAQGAKFSQICKMTDIFEGSIIRSMRRLEELMRQLVGAAKSIGNTDLENKFSEAIVKIKRDIVFAASLYL